MYFLVLGVAVTGGRQRHACLFVAACELMECYYLTLGVAVTGGTGTCLLTL